MLLHPRDQALTLLLSNRANLETVGEGNLNAEAIETGRRGSPAVDGVTSRERPDLHLLPAHLSRWTRSRAKRAFDVALVLAMLPLVLPVCLLIAIAIWLDTGGPILFLQKRVGKDGRTFSIVKFRTMLDAGPAGRSAIATIEDEQITPVGRVLRYWKLDEFPQLVNVIRGEMTLVGPRPRVPNQQVGILRCRPGITGAASLAFAREEVLLAGIPKHQLDSYYDCRVLPLKQRLDDGYMAQATLFSDLKLLLITAVRVWGAEDLEAFDVLCQDRYPAGAPLPGEGCD
jgi:lipopolysaccharide/colanic/teichoic acid biosynthesis glycosyltransferase